MKTLYDLAEGIRTCTACPLWKSRTLAVPGAGPTSAALMFIGEAPGVEEDRQGLPFVGRSGTFLNTLLLMAHVKREDVFITGSCKCHPPGNRLPTAAELRICKDFWLEKQVALINPNLVVLLGKTAARNLLGEVDLQKQHGEIVEKEGRKYFITFHPAAGMRFPKIKKMMMQDFEKLGCYRPK